MSSRPSSAVRAPGGSFTTASAIGRLYGLPSDLDELAAVPLERALAVGRRAVDDGAIGLAEDDIESMADAFGGFATPR